MVTFVVGPKGRKLENTQKSVLCVRSEYFDTMFRSEVQCPDEVHVQETSFEAFESVIIYLLTDQVCVDTTTQHAFDTMDLARRYQIKRLELLCQQQVEEGLDEHNAVPLMEASNALSHDRLASICGISGSGTVCCHWWAMAHLGGVQLGELTSLTRHHRQAFSGHACGGIAQWHLSAHSPPELDRTVVRAPGNAGAVLSLHVAWSFLFSGHADGACLLPADIAPSSCSPGLPAT